MPGSGFTPKQARTQAEDSWKQEKIAGNNREKAKQFDLQIAMRYREIYLGIG